MPSITRVASNGTTHIMPCNARTTCNHRKHGWRKRKPLNRSTKTPPSRQHGWPQAW